MLKKDKYNGIELNKWYRHRGSLTVPKRVQEMIKLDSVDEIIAVCRLRGGRILKLMYPNNLRWLHYGLEGDVMAYRFITKKTEESKK